MSELTAIFGIVGIGNKFLQIGSRVIILVIIIVISAKGYQFLAVNLMDLLIAMDHAVKAW